MMVHLVCPLISDGRQGYGRPVAFADGEDAIAYAREHFPKGCDINKIPIQPLSAKAQSAIDHPDLPSSIGRQELAYLRSTTRPDADLQAAAKIAGIEA